MLSSTADDYVPPVLGGPVAGLVGAPHTVRPKSVPQIIISVDSSAEDVEKWLKLKKFRPM